VDWSFFNVVFPDVCLECLTSFKHCFKNILYYNFYLWILGLPNGIKDTFATILCPNFKQKQIINLEQKIMIDYIIRVCMLHVHTILLTKLLKSLTAICLTASTSNNTMTGLRAKNVLKYENNIFIRLLGLSGFYNTFFVIRLFGRTTTTNKSTCPHPLPQ
jgi:hypothetical protein